MDSQSFGLRYISLWGFQSSPHALVYQGHDTANTTIIHLCLLKISIQMEQDSNLLSTSLFDWCSMGPSHTFLVLCLSHRSCCLETKKWVEAHLHHSWWPASSHTCWHMMHMRTKCLPEHTPLRQVAETFPEKTWCPRKCSNYCQVT